MLEGIPGHGADHPLRERQHRLASGEGARVWAPFGQVHKANVCACGGALHGRESESGVKACLLSQAGGRAGRQEGRVVGRAAGGSPPGPAPRVEPGQLFFPAPRPQELGSLGSPGSRSEREEGTERKLARPGSSGMSPLPSPPPPLLAPRAVQLAPSSLALVLRRLPPPAEVGPQEAAAAPDQPVPDDDDDEKAAVEDDEEEEEDAGGTAVFQAFRRANAACYWNAGLVRAVARVRLQGWLRGGVLLLQGPAAPLQLLRDAWLRRALRPPKGFLIRAVGDVSPVHMNPISQSQFVPLAEVLCCTISDMNAAHITVTQETLLDQLGKHYPGIATPTHDILYSTLGLLIKERKIYHTGEGYFIVTPNTYFISNNDMWINKRVLLEDSCPPEASVTYLVSMEDAEPEQDNLPAASHCRSCHCFLEHIIGGEKRFPQLVRQKSKGKSQKGSCESRFSVQKPACDTSAGNHSCETAHSGQLMKEKEKVKKFGLSLFWRNTSKKGKPKKVHSSFSAQFPPEEWPVRDEDNLDNIPRDVEHEIIKRINPVLTVDNLNKHTVLMQKIEEQKKYISKGTSTEVLTMKHKHVSKGCTQKKQNKPAKHYRKIHSNKEKQIPKAKKEFKSNELIPVHGKLDNTVEHPFSCTTNEATVCSKPFCEDAVDTTSHFIYKREINNPFQDIPCRGNKSTKERKSQKKCDRKSRTPRSEMTSRRSQSLDSSRTAHCKAKQSFAAKYDVEADKKKQLNCSQCHVSQADSKYWRERENCKHNLHGGAKPPHAVKVQVVPDIGGIEKKYTQNSSHTYQCKLTGVYNLLGQNSDHLQNVCLPSEADTSQQFNQPENTVAHRKNNHLKSELDSDNTSKWLESFNSQCKGFICDEEILGQKMDNGDACSSVYHDDEQKRHGELSKLQTIQVPCSSPDTGKWSSTEQETSPRVLGNRTSFPGCRTDLDEADKGKQEKNEFISSKDSLQEYPNMNLEGEGCVCQQVPEFAYKNRDEEGDDYDHEQTSAMTEPCAFAFYDVHEAETRIWQKSINELGGKSAPFTQSPKCWEIKANFEIKQRALDSTNDATVFEQRAQHEQNHLEGTGNHSITGDSGIDSPRTPSMGSASSAILDGLKKRRSFLMNLEGIEKTIKTGGRSLTQNSLLQLTPVMNV
ncbi:storkhead-box protein 1 [Pogona vitticeps]